MAAHAAVTTGQLDQPTSPNPGEVPASTTAGGGATIDPSASQEAPSEFQLAVTAAAKKECAAFALANAATQKTKESEEIAALKLDLATQKILRLEAENSALKAEAQLAQTSAASGKDSTSGTISARQAREKLWDGLVYVPPAPDNPFFGPDPRLLLANSDRPQPFSLRGDATADALQNTHSGQKFEYAILAPILYSLHNAVHFSQNQLREVVLDPDASEKDRAFHLDALNNSLERILEWFSVRHALIVQRARVSAGNASSEMVEHLQDAVYATVGMGSTSSTWVEELANRFKDQVDVSKAKQMAFKEAKTKIDSGAGAGRGGMASGSGSGKEQKSVSFGKDSYAAAATDRKRFGKK